MVPLILPLPLNVPGFWGHPNKARTCAGRCARGTLTISRGPVEDTRLDTRPSYSEEEQRHRKEGPGPPRRATTLQMNFVSASTRLE